MTRVTEGTSAATAQTSNTAAQSDSYVYPRWPWIWPLRSLRIVFVECIMRPLVALLAAPVVHGSNLLAQGPIIVIANHVTRFDVPLILYSLPPALRRRTAVAMAGDMIQDWRHARNQGAWWLNLFAPIQYLLVAALFNIFPLARSADFRRSFAHIGEALDRGYNLIIFPEGHRSMEGTLQPFRPGIGLLALESNAAILPIALHGLGTLKKERMGWFHSGRIAVRFGSLVHIDTTRSPEAISAELQRTIDELLRIE
jgi:long-chain acyl-CoA synthetase